MGSIYGHFDAIFTFMGPKWGLKLLSVPILTTYSGFSHLVSFRKYILAICD